MSTKVVLSKRVQAAELPPAWAARMHHALGVALCARGRPAEAEAALRAALASLDLDSYAAQASSGLALHKAAPSVTSEVTADSVDLMQCDDADGPNATAEPAYAPSPKRFRREPVSTFSDRAVRWSLDACEEVGGASAEAAAAGVAASAAAAHAARSHLRTRALVALALTLYHQCTATEPGVASSREAPRTERGNLFFCASAYLHPQGRTVDTDTARARRARLHEAVDLLATAEELLEGSRAAPLEIAAAADARGRCLAALGYARRALAQHQKSQCARREELPEGHLLLGHSHLNCGLALASLQARPHPMSPRPALGLQCTVQQMQVHDALLRVV